MIGYKPSNDPAADELRNSNLNRSPDDNVASTKSIVDKNQNGIENSESLSNEEIETRLRELNESDKELNRLDQALVLEETEKGTEEFPDLNSLDLSKLSDDELIDLLDHLNATNDEINQLESLLKGG